MSRPVTFFIAGNDGKSWDHAGGISEYAALINFYNKCKAGNSCEFEVSPSGITVMKDDGHFYIQKPDDEPRIVFVQSLPRTYDETPPITDVPAEGSAQQYVAAPLELPINKEVFKNVQEEAAEEREDRIWAVGFLNSIDNMIQEKCPNLTDNELDKCVRDFAKQMNFVGAEDLYDFVSTYVYLMYGDGHDVFVENGRTSGEFVNTLVQWVKEQERKHGPAFQKHVVMEELEADVQEDEKPIENLSQLLPPQYFKAAVQEDEESIDSSSSGDPLTPES